jgi:hypothetical protein
VARKLGQALDLALALDSRGVIGVERLDQPLDPVTDLKREVGSRRACQRPHVFDRHAVVAK